MAYPLFVEMAAKRQCGDWIESGTLGCGTFGLVSLWENKKTNKKIAVKTCKGAHLLTPKVKERWVQEVKIMKDIQHPNVIRAFPLPEELETCVAGPLPALCMEYCEGGDLRKTLSAPDNCCGVKETMILKVCGDIAEAIQCLHKQNIAHRDLKPENIVISTTNNEMICKVIDLGYAKHLDPFDSHHSLVGTPSYLAPEIITGTKKYTTSVDYWSYGILIFECCTGKRPFPQIRDYFDSIADKTRRHISALNDTKENMLTFSETLPEVNRLNRVLRPKFEDFLRLLLEWCPKQRGGNIKNDGTHSWVQCVRDILATKIVEVFCIDSCAQYTYELTPDVCLSDLAKSIRNDTGIPVEQQELFLADGSDLGSLSSLKPNMTVFVFDKVFKSDSKMNCCQHISSTMNEMLYDPGKFSNHSVNRHMQAWKHCVYYVQKQLLNNTCLKNGRGALMIRLLKNYWQLLSSKNDILRQKVTKLRLNIDFFKLSLDFDMKKYKMFFDKDGASRELWKPSVESWKAMEKSLDEIGILDEADVIFQEQESLQNTISKMKKDCAMMQTPQRSSNQMAMSRAKEVVAKYEQTRKIERVAGKHSCWKEKIADIRSITRTFMAENKKITDEFNQFLRDLVVLRQRLKEFFPRLEEVEHRAMKWSDKVEQMQRKRQEETWELLCTPHNKETYKQTSVETRKYNGSPSCRNIIEENQLLVERVTKTLQDVKEQQEMFRLESQCLDWTFCE